MIGIPSRVYVFIVLLGKDDIGEGNVIVFTPVLNILKCSTTHASVIETALVNRISLGVFIMVLHKKDKSKLVIV
ncbi:MAG: hypothetical protein DSY93_01885 [SAR324 cluster bacterium]|uniref:Uncharacterized protein n=1 Tax=SAR324 cluster bacterium TaxID=2024889 RepID=A0A432H8Y1_9DELT|nr:MAG: hypothetical protein DSY93_01885 [SAR324 cluster bacterium]